MKKRNNVLWHICLFFGYLLFFLFFQATTLYGGDAGDLVSAAYTGGIAHPPGYPLYSFLGYIVSHIPLSTVAWRVALLSSLPSAGTALLIYILVFSFTQSRISALIATWTLVTTYIFWLYAIVPEVFAFNALFISLLLYVAYSFSQSPSYRKLYLLTFLAGLSLTHHHTVIFVFPACIAWVLQQPLVLKKMRTRQFTLLIACFLGGLLPYAWAYISAVRIPQVIWDDPINIKNMVRLITRADYGSFQSGTKYAQDIRSRFLQFPALFNFYITDFRSLGMILFLVGGIYAYFKQRKIFTPLFLGFVLSGPVFFFYASYLLTTDFFIATAERFLLISYLFIAIFIGIGIHAIKNSILNMDLARIKRIKPILVGLILVLCAILPLSLFIHNYPKLSILKYDRTAERFGRDILMSVEPNSILFLQGDHPVFNTQYMYYTSKMRNDIIPIHASKFLNGTSYRQIRKYHPDLALPESKDTLRAIIPFISKHSPDYPIYSTVSFSLIPKGYTWVPYGLTYKLYKDEGMPEYSIIASEVDNVWSTYQDPYEGSLKYFNNLMLSNLIEHYKDASVRRGLYAVVYGEDYTNALRHYNYALKFDPKSGSILYLKGDAYIALKDCKNARDAFKMGYSRRTHDPYLYYDSMHALYTLCDPDTKKASFWEKKRNALIQEKETQLEGL